jgi:hypothetical protein
MRCIFVVLGDLDDVVLWLGLWLEEGDCRCV